MTTGQTRRRRTAQQILLRRACLSKTVGRVQDAAELPARIENRERSGIVVLPSLARYPALSQERSPSRAVRKFQRIPAGNTNRVSGERKTAGKLSGCGNPRKVSPSWKKVKQSDDNPNRSGHSLKSNEHSRGSTRSRHSSTTYPSSWQLNVSRVTEDVKDVDSNGSLDEIINCSCLNRTPYDHKLNTPLKSYHTCQDTFNKKVHRRNVKVKAVTVAETQTQTIQETQTRSRNHSSEYIANCRRTSSQSSGGRLKNRVYSGEEVRPCRNSSKSNSENSKSSFKCKLNCPGVTFKNYGGYSPSGTDIEMSSAYKSNSHFPCSESFCNKIDKVSKPPVLNGNKWSLRMPSNTEINRYFDGVNQERDDACAACPLNYSSSGSQGKNSTTGRASNDQSSCNCSPNKMRSGSDRNSRMIDSEGRCCPCGSKADRQGSRIDREASILSLTNSGQICNNDERDTDSLYNINNTKKNSADSPRICQKPSNEYLTRADPFYEPMLPKKENYPNKRCSNDYGYTWPNKKLQCEDYGADMIPNQKRQNEQPNGFNLDLGIAGTHKDPTICPHCSHRSTTSGPSDRMGGSRGSCGTGNRERITTRGPSEMENECNASKPICNRKCIEAVTQTSELLMAPRADSKTANCSSNPDRGSLKANICRSPLSSIPRQCIRTTQIKTPNDLICCGMDLSTPLKSEKKPSNSSYQKQLKTEKQTNVGKLSIKTQHTKGSSRDSSCSSKLSQEKAKQTHRPKTRKLSTSRRSQPRSFRSKKPSKEVNSSKRSSSDKTKKQSSEKCDCQTSVNRDQKEDQVDVIKILTELQKTVAGLEKEIKKRSEHESGRSANSGCEAKMKKTKCANEDLGQNYGQNRNSAHIPTSRSPCQQGFSSHQQQYNTPHHVCPFSNKFCQSYNGTYLAQFGRSSHQYPTNSQCTYHCSGANQNNMYQERQTMPYRNASDPWNTGRCTTTGQDYVKDITEQNAPTCPYNEQSYFKSYENNGFISNSPNIEWGGNSPQSNGYSGTTAEARYENYSKDIGQFGYQAPKDTECVPCQANQASKNTEFVPYQSMYQADEAPPTNRCGVSFCHDTFGKETEEYPGFPRSNRTQSYQTENAFEHLNNNCLYGEKETRPAPRPPYQAQQRNPETPKQRTSTHQKRLMSSSPSRPKRVGSPKRQGFPISNKLNTSSIQPKTRKENDKEICENQQCPERLNREANKNTECNNSQCPVKLNRGSNKSNLSKCNEEEDRSKRSFDTKLMCENPQCPKKVSKNIEPQYEEESGIDLCENPSCPVKNGYENESFKAKEKCENPQCPKKIPKNIEPQYEEESGIDLCENPSCPVKNGYGKETFKDKKKCENPQCPKKIPKNIKSQDEDESRTDICDNPCCPDKKRYGKETFTGNYMDSQSDSTKNKKRKDVRNEDTADSCPEDCPKRVLFFDAHRQGSGRSDRYDFNSMDTKSCHQNKRHQYVPLENYCRTCKCEAKRKPHAGECNLCMNPGIQPTISSRNRHNPHMMMETLNSYDRHILGYFEKYKLEKVKYPFVSNCSCPEETVEEYSEDDAKRTSNRKPEESSEYEGRKSTSKRTIYSCCMKPPKEETQPYQKEIPPKTKDKPRPKQLKSSEKSKSKSSGFLCFKKEDNHSKTSIRPEKERHRNPRENDGEVIFPKEEILKKEDKSKKPSRCIEFVARISRSRDQYQRPSARIVCRNRQKVKSVEGKDQECCNYKSETPTVTCPCADDDDDTGEVKVLYDSSFRFTQESRSCAEIPKILYGHNNKLQKPRVQEESESSGPFCRQKFEEQDNTYRQCGSANGFYKIVQ